MAKIPAVLHSYINSAYPANVCLVGAMRADGFPNASPRGSVVVLDDETLGLWDRGGRASSDALKDGAKLMVYFRNTALAAVARGGNGLLPVGGIARFYGSAVLAKSGAMYDRVWAEMPQPERDADKEKKGFAVLIKVEKAEDLRGQALPADLAVPQG